ncbi:5'/3'-nucleotidase SurE [candidate division KSB1 bacterium]|nr:5'/3'-nucleotidase SurE [candidate division KSB1 bacterium]
MERKPFFMLSNDDGIDAPGLHAMYDVLKEIGEVAVVAPATEMSAVGHAITLSDPLRVWSYHRRGEFFGYAVKGTPADCIKIGYWALLKRKPDVVISGINLGANTGINTIYSGTVSAATEGAILGVPSFAISLATYEDPKFEYAAKFAAKITLELLQRGLPEGVFLNVNVPACDEEEIQGISITRQGKAVYKETFDKRNDPRGNVYYWLSGQKVEPETSLDVDDGAVAANRVSITPVHYDLTKYDVLDELKSWSLEP